MASPFLSALILFLVSSSFILPLSHSSINIPVNDAFALRLIHRDSPHSPFYNHSMTAHNRRLAAAHRSISSLHHLLFRVNGGPEFSPKLIPASLEYVINFYVVTPPTHVYAFIDTGSDFIWIKGIPFFDPSKSSTYANLLCDSGLCNDLGISKTCKDLQELCTYQYVCADKAYTSGVLSRDRFEFELKNPAGTSIVNVGFVQFGYSKVTSSEFTGKENGCVGLNYDDLSLITQLGIKKFSHCLTIPDDLVPGSYMYFGLNAVVNGSQTSIVQNPVKIYAVGLEGISVGDQMVEQNVEGIIIDSGTAYTILRPELLQPILDKMKQFIKKPLLPGIPGLFELCFNGTFDDVRDLPNVTFHFVGGADFQPIKETTFVEIADSVCRLAFLRSSLGLNVFGNVQMRNFWVGYDLERGVISFQPELCAVFNSNVSKIILK
ncbi:hypothetical protein L6164_025493 [Bauhinia variegata]|uniref:Uncharacterized protein n=1 Tax=Bauhinia variegata TaxID=167791 RepID=A0ACB9M0N4_BAUVA|nr:hypothetical protein L6164_025493 [Bauhinia variegata]